MLRHLWSYLDKNYYLTRPWERKIFTRVHYQTKRNSKAYKHWYLNVSQNDIILTESKSNDYVKSVLSATSHCRDQQVQQRLQQQESLIEKGCLKT